MRDGLSEIKVTRGLIRTAIGSNTTTAGVIIDLQGFDACTWAIYSETLTDGTFTPKIEHDDVVGFGTAVEPPAAELVGTLINATFALTDDNVVKKVGYRGNKRFVRLSIVSTVVTTGGAVGALAILGEATLEPQA